jgi:hypothetical protein
VKIGARSFLEKTRQYEGEAQVRVTKVLGRGGSCAHQAVHDHGIISKYLNFYSANFIALAQTVLQK